MAICHDVSTAVVVSYGAMPRTPLYVGKWSFAFWSVCTSTLLLPQPPSFWPLMVCVFYCYFFSYVILRVQFWIDCVLPPSAVVYLPTNTCCAGGYLVSTHHYLHTHSWSLVDQLHKSWVGLTSGDPPFIIGMLPWNQAVICPGFQICLGLERFQYFICRFWTANHPESSGDLHTHS